MIGTLIQDIFQMAYVLIFINTCKVISILVTILKLRLSLKLQITKKFIINLLH